jgi:hypothetical protein
MIFMGQPRRNTLARFLAGRLPPARTECPYCRAEVDGEVTQCPACDHHFPAMRHRVGNPLMGAVCGVLRGLGLIAAIAALLLLWPLIEPPFQWRELGRFLIATGVFAVCLWLVTIAHRRAYRVE